MATAAAGFFLKNAMISTISTLVLALSAVPAAQAELEAPEGGYSFNGDVNYVQILDQTLRLNTHIEAPNPQERVVLMTSASPNAMEAVAGEYVMFEAKGPGMIAKMHLGRSNGSLRFYTDGAEQPSWEIDIPTLFSAQSPIPRPLVRTVDGKHLLTVPIPYQKSMRVTTTDPDLIFEAAVRTMGEGVSVPSWDSQMLADSVGILHRTARAITTDANPSGIRTTFMAGGVDRRFPFKYVLHGNGILQWIKFTMIGKDGPSEEELAEYLRHMRLRIYDGADSKDDGRTLVDVPFGDFFGVAPGTTTYNSWAFSEVSQGQQTFTVRYPMPYSGGFGIKITATRKLPKTVRFRCDVGFLQKLEPPKQRFRASYFQHQGLKTDQPQTLRLAELSGPGRFLGSTLTVLNAVKDPWGNGGLRIAVDGEKTPSWNSSSAYLFYDRLTRQDGPFEFGYNSMNRPLMNDAIPFQESLTFDLDLKHSAKTEVDLSGVVYWYSPKTDTTEDLAYTPEQLIPKPLPDVVDEQVVGALEAENFRIQLVKGDGKVEPTTKVPENTSGGMLAWAGAQKGQYIKLNFDVASTATWQTQVQLYTYPGGPKVRLYLNGKKAGPQLDLNAPTAGWKTFDLGAHMLPEREHLLTLALESAPTAAEFPTICIDFMRLTMK